MAGATQSSAVPSLDGLVLNREPVATWQVSLSGHADVMEKYGCFLGMDGESWLAPRDALRDPELGPAPAKRQAPAARAPQGARASVASLFRARPAMSAPPVQPPRFCNITRAPVRAKATPTSHAQEPAAKRRKVGGMFR